MQPHPPNARMCFTHDLAILTTRNVSVTHTKVIMGMNAGDRAIPLVIHAWRQTQNTDCSTTNTNLKCHRDILEIFISPENPMSMLTTATLPVSLQSANFKFILSPISLETLSEGKKGCVVYVGCEWRWFDGWNLSALLNQRQRAPPRKPQTKHHCGLYDTKLPREAPVACMSTPERLFAAAQYHGRTERNDLSILLQKQKPF